ncbi:unnamed protein product [Prorocentrum cordatum]|uniref:Uncharacterized protein n=1 Tax=Prorocentrum cordatum TaxID=2364126 RepID=A0ABN9VEM3_9DINO|nr:unnamed protein product [Polarella glacialis]
MSRLRSLSSALGQWAILSSVGIHVARYQGGDYIAQVKGHTPFDRWRSAAFAGFGAYCGGVYHFVYGPIYTWLFLSRGVGAVPVILFDMLVTVQVLYFPVYYALQEVVRSATPAWGRVWADLHANRGRVRLRPPINYTYVPSAWRGTFSGVAGIGWAVLLSCSRGERQAECSIGADRRAAGPVLLCAASFPAEAQPAQPSAPSEPPRAPSEPESTPPGRDASLENLLEAEPPESATPAPAPAKPPASARTTPAGRAANQASAWASATPERRGSADKQELKDMMDLSANEIFDKLVKQDTGDTFS